MAQDIGAAPADFSAIFRPLALSPVAETTRLGHEQVEQSVAIGVAVLINGSVAESLVELGAQLIHGREQVLVAGDPADVVRPRAAFQGEMRLLFFDVSDGLIRGARLPFLDARQDFALIDRPATGQHALRARRLARSFPGIR